MGIRYATLCSGIGCAELAADPLGWEPAFQSEIDPFACALLRERFPSTPNLGDMTVLAARIRDGEVDDDRLPDVLVAGTPCTSFSIAGLGMSLDSPVGRLTLELVNVLNAIDERRAMLFLPSCTLVWENVPNVLSKDDNPFGCLVGALVGSNRPVPPFGKPRGGKRRWPRAGLVRGPRRSLAWRILDAQYFGVAQRRRRLFLVAGAGDGFDPAAVLLEFDGVRRDTPPSREKGQKTTGTISARATAGGGLGTDFDCDGGLVPVSHTLSAARGAACANAADLETYIPVPVAFDTTQLTSPLNFSNPQPGDPYHPLASSAHVPCIAYGGNNQSGAIDVATARSAHPSASGRMDFETETFLVQAYQQHGSDVGNMGCLRSGHGDVQSGVPLLVTGGDVTHALNTANNGKHCSEDGTGRGVPIIAFNARQDAISDPHISDALSGSSPQASAIAFQDRFRGDDGRGIGPPPVTEEIIGSLETVKQRNVAAGMRVRRLTVVECERLQGLPDNFTLFRDPRTRKKLEDDYFAYLLTHCPRLTRSEAEVLAKDGPRYRAIGNGMAVPVMHWILARLDRHMNGDL